MLSFLGCRPLLREPSRQPSCPRPRPWLPLRRAAWNDKTEIPTPERLLVCRCLQLDQFEVIYHLISPRLKKNVPPTCHVKEYFCSVMCKSDLTEAWACSGSSPRSWWPRGWTPGPALRSWWCNGDSCARPPRWPERRPCSCRQGTEKSVGKMFINKFCISYWAESIGLD